MYSASYAFIGRRKRREYRHVQSIGADNEGGGEHEKSA